MAAAVPVIGALLRARPCPSSAGAGPRRSGCGGWWGCDGQRPASARTGGALPACADLTGAFRAGRDHGAGVLRLLSLRPHRHLPAPSPRGPARSQRGAGGTPRGPTPGAHAKGVGLSARQMLPDPDAPARRVRRRRARPPQGGHVRILSYRQDPAALQTLPPVPALPYLVPGPSRKRRAQGSPPGPPVPDPVGPAPRRADVR
jgi:hypothetical protein